VHSRSFEVRTRLATSQSDFTPRGHPPQDATSSIDTLRGLSRMAGSGMNIITVIHQPRFSVYELFDSVLLLGVGGHAVYSGPPLLARTYFERNGFSMPPHENIADWNLDVISGCAVGARCLRALHMRCLSTSVLRGSMRRLEAYARCNALARSCADSAVSTITVL
jgi:ABC-2 type transporter